MIGPARTLAVETLRTLVGLHHIEEIRLRAILASEPNFKTKMLTQFNLDKVLRRCKTQSEELEKLERER